MEKDSNNDKKIKDEYRRNFDKLLFYVKIKNLTTAEKLFVFHLACQHNKDHPVIRQMSSLTSESLVRILDMVATTFELVIVNFNEGLERMAKIIEREALYNRLLKAGAPKEMLGKHFAKSRRNIELDRKVSGVRAAHVGRPRLIENEKAYEIIGHWERLSAEKPDYSERFEAVSQLCPGISLASLYMLLKQV